MFVALFGRNNTGNKSEHYKRRKQGQQVRDPRGTTDILQDYNGRIQ